MCGCGQNEIALRHYAYPETSILPAMTAEQREWCIKEAEHAGEGSYPRNETENLSDEELAKAVLKAWWDYVRSNVL